MQRNPNIECRGSILTKHATPQSKLDGTHQGATVDALLGAWTFRELEASARVFCSC
jgi:hypothetical protein